MACETFINPSTAHTCARVKQPVCLSVPIKQPVYLSVPIKQPVYLSVPIKIARFGDSGFRVVGKYYETDEHRKGGAKPNIVLPHQNDAFHDMLHPVHPRNHSLYPFLLEVGSGNETMIPYHIMRMLYVFFSAKKEKI